MFATLFTETSVRSVKEERENNVTQPSQVRILTAEISVE
jgi:hypothetical protein